MRTPIFALALPLIVLALNLSAPAFGKDQPGGDTKILVMPGSGEPGAVAADALGARVGSGAALDESNPGPGETRMEGRTGSQEKSLANGLYMSGIFTYFLSGSTATATVTLNRINNDSTTRTTGTLRLELWASVAKPARGANYNGYKMGESSLLNPMLPQTYYANLSETRPYVRPPDGTYWIVLALTEYNPAACSLPDGYCLADSFVSFSQETFGAPPPPPSLGVLTKTLGSRGTITPSATLYGGFEVAAASKVYILVRGNSLGTLGITQSYLDAPHLRLYTAQGVDLVSQGGLVGVNYCLASNTVTDYPVVAFYQARGQPVHSRDSCYVTTLLSGVYTFTVTPSFLGTTSSVTNSANPSGEVLFEVSLARP